MRKAPAIMSALSRLTLLAGLLAVFVALSVGVRPADAAPAIEEVTSPGGIRAWLVNEPSIPVIAVRVAWRGGSRLDPADKPGVANLLSGLLDEGAGELDSEAFQHRLAELAIKLSFDAGRDAFAADLTTLSENRDEAFRLLALALESPRFDEEPVARIRRQILSSLSRAEADPGTLAGRAWMAAAFPGHPYSRPSDGTLASVPTITVEDLQTWRQRYLALDNIVISVVGDIDAKTLGPLLDKTFGSLPAKTWPTDVPEVEPAGGGRLEVIPFDNPQSQVIFGREGVKRDDPDYYAAYVMNYVLGGGGFESRLNEEIREKRGLVYSVYSYVNPLDFSSLLMGGLGTSNDQVAEAIELVRKEVGRLREDGVTEAELADAKTYINGSFPLRLSSNASIARILVAMQLDHLGIDYLEKRDALIEKVTLDDVRRVARRLLDPKDMLIVVVGSPHGLDGAVTRKDG
ncbi:M16 family metallopeptidase [Oceanibacterium hippocampi]|uniref:Peptidase M16 inactive domain protein n=1 Tax=Oceanibacterium hippocampi TaxID=745714 RepID=A0A1Y5S5V8_9PROT|nr:pitrilysin family protein [Oceanibacterium hippocampi]SLN32926.1 Peptidase M16 inactive domain protein [Oceanibacterium hippocampi]